MIVLPLHINNNTFRYQMTIALQHVLARMETSSQLEKHESPSASGTNVSGSKPTPKSPNTPFASGPEPDRLGRPCPAEEDDDSWLQRIDLRAVECCEEGIELSTPPFPFYHRWDPEYRTKKDKHTARASDANYDQWTADGKPDCLACGKRHPPPCSAALCRKRQAEEEGEGSTTRASRRRGAVRRKHRAPAQTAPATMAPSSAPQVAPAPRVRRTYWEIMNETPEIYERATTLYSVVFELCETEEERVALYNRLFTYHLE
jgi:hypothetical protein